jgi:hypothetical protein
VVTLVKSRKLRLLFLVVLCHFNFCYLVLHLLIPIYVP